MTSVIQKYVTEGVLNYIDHETPRHYFLYDGVIEEEKADVHRLVEDLCDENLAMQRRIKDLEDQMKWYRDRVVWGFYEDGTPKFYQGKDGESEICEPVSAKEVTNYVKALDTYERERERFRHAKPEITGEYFLTGGHGNTDDNKLPQYVRICPAYGCHWEQVYEKTDKTITYEGS